MTWNDAFLLGSVPSQSDSRIISMLFCVFVNCRSKLMMSQVDDNEMDTRFEVGSTVFAYVDIRPRMAENGRRLPEDFPKTSRDELP